MTTYENGCVETPEWQPEPRPDPFAKVYPLELEAADDTPHTRGEN